ncbi:TrkH family potassium uptake protein [Halocola ammonii]
MSLQSFREKANLFLYGNKKLALRTGKALNVVVTIGAVITLVYLYGYEHKDEEEAVLLNIIQGSFGFYVFHYILRFVYDFHPQEFFRKTWFEGIAMAILLVEGIAFNFFDTLLFQELFKQIGISDAASVSTVLIQFYFVCVVVIEALRASSIFPRFKLHPATVFIFSFMAIIVSGTGLLLLPEMTTKGSNLSFLDALFTSTSAGCVTGLMTVDASTEFTFKGQMVLLFLIQVGGFNIIAFGSFIALASKLGLGVKHHDVIEDFVNRDTALSAQGMLRKVFLWAFTIEILGALGFYIFWGEVTFANRGDRIFNSIFHSVSSFNNAGISLFSNGFYETGIRENYIIHWIIIILIFAGSIGMVALFDMFDIKRLRDRMRNSWKTISFSTKIALYFTIALTILTAVPYFILEYDNTLADKSFFGKFTATMFQAVTPRSCGFNTVDYHQIGMPMLFVTIVMMFIGSSSSSTGGGIKTSTLGVIYADLLSTIKGLNYTELFKKTIPAVLKSRAYAVLNIFLVGNLICIFLLTISEQHILEMPDRDFMDLVFEQVSALSTTGLSTGITPMLTPFGKSVIMVSMVVGRVGTLTVAYAFVGKLISKNYKYPEGHTMIG